MSDAVSNNNSSDNQTPSTDTQVDNTTEGGIKAGGRVYKDQSELVAAFDSLSSSVGEKGRRIGTLKKLVTEDPSLSEDEKRQLEEDFLADPVKVLQVIKKQAKTEMEKEIQNRNETNSFWDGFFAKNPHLSNAKEKVQHDVYTRLFPQLDGKNTDEQYAEIEKEWGFMKPQFASDSSYKPPVTGSSNAGGKTPQATLTTDNKPKGLSDLVNEIYKD